MREVQLRAAKAQFSSVVDAAEQGECTIITRHGKPAAVVIGFADWQEMAKTPSFGELLAMYPLQAGDLPERDHTPMREPER
jgi:prevent-host-death family protein